MVELQVCDVWMVQILILFFEVFLGILGLLLMGCVLVEGLWNLCIIDLCFFGIGKYCNVDDMFVGGGVGMVICFDVMLVVLYEVGVVLLVIYLFLCGKFFMQVCVCVLVEGLGMMLICGWFEGVDQCVLDVYGVEEISIGDYVLIGGEFVVQVLIDVMVCFILCVLGNQELLVEEFFFDGFFEYLQYMKFVYWEGCEIFEVLFLGNYVVIVSW